MLSSECFHADLKMGKSTTLITPALIRQLLLPCTADAASPAHVSAASGMVMAGEFLYVVADDDLHLAVFAAHGRGEGRLIQLLPGQLPDSPPARKATKPDLEVLVRLPPCGGYPHGALLALGSGSRPNRRAGVILGLDANGHARENAERINLSGLYIPLESRFPALNIEGALVREDELVLLQRGSRNQPENALIRFKLADALHSMRATGDAPLLAALQTQVVDLGFIKDIPLCFTDGAALADGRIVFSAVAENAADNYLDGVCVGAAVGLLDADGQLQQLQYLQPVYKIEGIHAVAQDDTIRLLMVTDADDPRIPGNLLSAELSKLII